VRACGREAPGGRAVHAGDRLAFLDALWRHGDGEPFHPLDDPGSAGDGEHGDGGERDQVRHDEPDHRTGGGGGRWRAEAAVTRWHVKLGTGSGLPVSAAMVLCVVEAHAILTAGARRVPGAEEDP
jgi:hypothetical protein